DVLGILVHRLRQFRALRRLARFVRGFTRGGICVLSELFQPFKREVELTRVRGRFVLISGGFVALGFLGIVKFSVLSFVGDVLNSVIGLFLILLRGPCLPWSCRPHVPCLRWPDSARSPFSQPKLSRLNRSAPSWPAQRRQR